jgi:hypothetical protein
MHRTTLMLPPDLKTRAQSRAREMGISFGELVRQALESELSAPPGRRDDDPLFADVAVFGGEAPADLSAAHDRYLYDEHGG